MSSGLYSALSGSVAKMQQLDMAVNNLANSGNTGFKSSRLSFESLFDENLQNNRGQGMNFTRSSSRFIDFSQGDIKKTDRSLDLAIKGEGFFKVAGENGFLYSRQGNFQLDNQGNLVTATDGLQVVGEDGPIRFPHQDVHIDQQGRVFSDGAQVGQVTLYDVAEKQDLTQKADGLWALKPGAEDRPANGADLLQGRLEQSNVNPLLSTTGIIEIKRAYAAYLKTMKAFGEMAEQARSIGQVG
ncbi:MAG: flagellar basal-body rod protein FlgF [Thermodesulfobacteriota bacterium]